MNEKKRAEVMASLSAGNHVIPHWRGSNLSGRLVYKLEGIARITEKEVDLLRKEGVIRAVTFAESGRHYGPFKPLKLNK